MIFENFRMAVKQTLFSPMSLVISNCKKAEKEQSGQTDERIRPENRREGKMLGNESGHDHSQAHAKIHGRVQG